MELLGREERYQEAEQDYQQFLLALAELGPTKDGHSREPDPRTRDIREYLLTKQLQRQRVQSPTMSVIEAANNARGNATLSARLFTSPSAPILLPSSCEHDLSPDFSHAGPQDVMETIRVSTLSSHFTKQVS